MRHAGGSPSSRAHVARVTTGCSTRFKKGSHLSPFAGTAYEWEGRSFSRVSSAHARTSPSYQPSSAQPTVEFVVPPRTRYREERWSSALHSRTVSCTALRKVSMVLGGSLPAPRRKTRGNRTPVAPNTRGREARAFAMARVETLSRQKRKARIGRSGSRSRVVQVVAEVDSWLFWRREAGASTSQEVGSVRGRASSARASVRKHERPSANGHQHWALAETVT